MVPARGLHDELLLVVIMCGMFSNEIVGGVPDTTMGMGGVGGGGGGGGGGTQC